jgi:TolA-binding protein
MFKYFTHTLLSIFLLIGQANSQSIEGLRDIVSLQQDKISTIEDNLKKLVGSVEQQLNIGNKNQTINLIEKQINELNNKIRLLENNIKNITDLSYNLDFAMKRIERHLELRSIQNNSKNQTNNLESKLEPNYTKEKIENVKKKSLNGKTDGVLGFIKDNSDKDIQNDKKSIVGDKAEIKTVSELPKGSPDDNFNYALDLARQLDFENAEKAFKEFLIIHKNTKLQADAQYWLGRVYFAQKKYEEAAIAMAEFNSVFPNDSRFQETTLLIAEAAVNFAPKNQLCDILNQSLEFMINPSNKFVKRINSLKNEKQCSTE